MEKKCLSIGPLGLIGLIGPIIMCVTFEGIEGSGKSTQIKLLEQKLVATGLSVLLTREPGGTPIGDQIRQVLLDAKNKAMVPECELLLYYAARAQHIQQKVKPACDQGQVVLCDRFVDATMAYQGAARGLQSQFLTQLNDYVLNGFHADLTLLFDLPVEVGLSRAKKRADQLEESQKEDRFEQEAVDFHHKVRQAYLDLAKNNPNRFEIVNADQSVEDLQKQVFKIVSERLGL